MWCASWLRKQANLFALTSFRLGCHNNKSGCLFGVLFVAQAREMKLHSLEDVLEKVHAGAKRSISRLDLHQKQLTGLPDLSDLVNLRTLDISGNQLRKLDFIASNKSLSTVNAYDNQITDLDAINQLINLSVLHAQFNKLKNIDNCFLNLTNLVDLRLDNNQITDLPADSLSHCESLVNLDLSYNLLTNFEFASQLPNLTYLSVNHNKILSVSPLASCLKLVDLDVSDNCLTAVENGLDGHGSLQRINLSRNCILRLKQMRPLSSLTTLLIQQNGVVELGALSQYFPKIETLDISCNQLTDFSNFLAELKHCELLREVNFEGNPWSHGPSGEASDFEELVKSQLPQVLIFKTKKRGESTPVVVEGSARDGGHQLYELIERQLTSMKESTAPIERCLNESYSAIQNMLEKLKDVGPDGEDKLKSDGQGSSRCGVRTKLTEALEYASSKGQAIEEHNKI